MWRVGGKEWGDRGEQKIKKQESRVHFLIFLKYQGSQPTSAEDYTPNNIWIYGYFELDFGVRKEAGIWQESGESKED